MTIAPHGNGDGRDGNRDDDNADQSNEITGGNGDPKTPNGNEHCHEDRGRVPRHRRRHASRRRSKTHCAMNLSISADVRGAAVVKMRAPSVVISTSSSMRTPIALYLSRALAMDACSSLVIAMYTSTGRAARFFLW